MKTPVEGLRSTTIKSLQAEVLNARKHFPSGVTTGVIDVACVAFRSALSLHRDDNLPAHHVYMAAIRLAVIVLRAAEEGVEGYPYANYAATEQPLFGTVKAPMLPLATADITGRKSR